MSIEAVKDRIIVCGGNGAGKSTLGRALANHLGYAFRDIEDYYFPDRKKRDPYASPRTGEEAARALYDDLSSLDRCVLAAVRGAYGERVEALFTRAVFIDVPKKERLRRVRERSYQKFGSRMLKGGDLYESEKRFFAMVEAREACDVEMWLTSIGLPFLTVDGTRPTEEIVQTILKSI